MNISFITLCYNGYRKIARLNESGASARVKLVFVKLFDVLDVLDVIYRSSKSSKSSKSNN